MYGREITQHVCYRKSSSCVSDVYSTLGDLEHAQGRCEVSWIFIADSRLLSTH